MSNRFRFLGGQRGVWRVTGMTAVSGAGLDPVAAVDVVNNASPDVPDGTSWVLQGFTSNIRYATTTELRTLQAIQQPPGRPDSTRAALIPLKKTSQWWDLPQDARRRIFEETSHHTEIGMRYLPPIARRLHHCRDLGEPFDFVTWFECAPEYSAAFDDLLAKLRATEEWSFIEREVDIRLERAHG